MQNRAGQLARVILIVFVTISTSDRLVAGEAVSAGTTTNGFGPISTAMTNA
ncbi:MAG: hypothetical protein CM1200mP2_40090 [Planctomycetaceae bacterium]|nr:MAG: hypothetical protein CM1200mP2_40090 [Planctomycetaceae bacterium]